MHNKGPYRWYRFGKPWGLLEKTNPKATPKSVLIHAICYAIAVIPIWYSLQQWRWNWTAAFWTLILASLFFATIAALCEWQIDNSDEEF